MIINIRVRDTSEETGGPNRCNNAVSGTTIIGNSTSEMTNNVVIRRVEHALRHLTNVIIAIMELKRGIVE